MIVYLGYDTSCYTTSIAAVNENSQILANCKTMLPVDIGKRGLRQNEAVFKHLKQINNVYMELLDKINNTNFVIGGIGASEKPRSIENSYMPVFEVGKEFAKHLSKTLKVPYVSTSHQNGHIEAAKHETGIVSKKFLALHLSGGTTELLKINNGNINIVAKTLDISAGQLIDRVGVALGYKFPAGKYLEELALSCQIKPEIPYFKSSLSKNGLDCNFSGAETAAISMIGKIENSILAYEVFDFIARSTSKMINEASKKENINELLIFGGVASSNLYRNLIMQRVKKLNNKIKIIFGKNDLSSDNAVGVALLTMKKLTGGIYE